MRWAPRPGAGVDAAAGMSGIRRNDATEIHADTQGQSLPAFRLATMLGIELLPPHPQLEGPHLLRCSGPSGPRGWLIKPEAELAAERDHHDLSLVELHDQLAQLLARQPSGRPATTSAPVKKKPGQGR